MPAISHEIFLIGKPVDMGFRSLFRRQPWPPRSFPGIFSGVSAITGAELSGFAGRKKRCVVNVTLAPSARSHDPAGLRSLAFQHVLVEPGKAHGIIVLKLTHECNVSFLRYIRLQRLAARQVLCDGGGT